MKNFTFIWYLLCFSLGLNSGNCIAQIILGNVSGAFGYGLATIYCGAWMASIWNYERLHALLKKSMKLNDEIFSWIEEARKAVAKKEAEGVK